MENLANKGYTQEDIIGRQGIEATMEETLREQNGYKIDILDEEGNTKATIAETEGADGDNIVLSIDSYLQDICYKAMTDYKGNNCSYESKNWRDTGHGQQTFI